MIPGGPLATLALRFGILSLFAVGGGVSILIPQMHEEFVNQYHWLDDRSFSEIIAVAQAAPGPNFLLVPLIGWRVEGWLGALVALGGFLVAPIAISYLVGRTLRRHDNAFVALVRRALRAVTSGLWIAAGLVIARTVDHTVTDLAVTGAVVVLALFVDVSPLWWCLCAGAIGALLA